MLYPFLFQPILKERVWGGRHLATLYGKPLSGPCPVGESWEISDRPGDASVIVNGPLAGKNLRWLMEHHEQDLLGAERTRNGRFPLLVKILDARERLSLQVHPPPQMAGELRAEPKTEMWFITDADPGAELCVGLKPGVSREEFAAKIQDGTVADCVHHVPVRKGDAMFLPSGRLHAIGAGLVIFEIQQNSDTTYRVFDWNRAGLDGKARELHVSAAMASIDFQDFAPETVRCAGIREGAFERRDLVLDPLFEVRSWRAQESGQLTVPTGVMSIVGVAEGRVAISGSPEVALDPGQFCLIPASAAGRILNVTAGSVLLMVQAGVGAQRVESA